MSRASRPCAHEGFPIVDNACFTCRFKSHMSQRPRQAVQFSRSINMQMEGFLHPQTDLSCSEVCRKHTVSGPPELRPAASSCFAHLLMDRSSSVYAVQRQRLQLARIATKWPAGATPRAIRLPVALVSDPALFCEESSDCFDW